MNWRTSPPASTSPSPKLCSGRSKTPNTSLSVPTRLDEPLAETGVLSLEVLDQVRDGAALRLHLSRALGDRPEGSGDPDQNWHRFLSSMTALETSAPPAPGRTPRATGGS